jgi:CDP-glycerol glycerophosphotransferase (TagB/SpsB family)
VVKFKDTSPDNFLDIQVADVLITNFSSIANLFYATGRPTIHIYPVGDPDAAFTYRSYMRMRGVKTARVASARDIWKLDPEINGGLLANKFEMLLALLDQALDDPSCCRQKSREFLDHYMMGADGRASERALATLMEISQK